MKSFFQRIQDSHSGTRKLISKDPHEAYQVLPPTTRANKEWSQHGPPLSSSTQQKDYTPDVSRSGGKRSTHAAPLHTDPYHESRMASSGYNYATVPSTGRTHHTTGHSGMVDVLASPLPPHHTTLRSQRKQYPETYETRPQFLKSTSVMPSPHSSVEKMSGQADGARPSRHGHSESVHVPFTASTSAQIPQLWIPASQQAPTSHMGQRRREDEREKDVRLRKTESRARETGKERDRDKEREQRRDRDQTREMQQERERERRREKDREGERERERDRDRERRREKEKEKAREKDKKRAREKDRRGEENDKERNFTYGDETRSEEKGRERHRDRYREPGDGQRERIGEEDKDGQRDRGRVGERERKQAKDKTLGREQGEAKDSERHHHRKRTYDRDRDRATEPYNHLDLRREPEREGLSSVERGAMLEATKRQIVEAKPDGPDFSDRSPHKQEQLLSTHRHHRTDEMNGYVGASRRPRHESAAVVRVAIASSSNENQANNATPHGMPSFLPTKESLHKSSHDRTYTQVDLMQPGLSGSDKEGITRKDYRARNLATTTRSGHSSRMLAVGTADPPQLRNLEPKRNEYPTNKKPAELKIPSSQWSSSIQNQPDRRPDLSSSDTLVESAERLKKRNMVADLVSIRVAQGPPDPSTHGLLKPTASKEVAYSSPSQQEGQSRPAHASQLPLSHVPLKTRSEMDRSLNKNPPILSQDSLPAQKSSALGAIPDSRSLQAGSLRESSQTSLEPLTASAEVPPVLMPASLDSASYNHKASQVETSANEPTVHPSHRPLRARAFDNVSTAQTQTTHAPVLSNTLSHRSLQPKTDPAVTQFNVTSATSQRMEVTDTRPHESGTYGVSSVRPSETTASPLQTSWMLPTSGQIPQGQQARTLDTSREQENVHNGGPPSIPAPTHDRSVPNLVAQFESRSQALDSLPQRAVGMSIPRPSTAMGSGHAERRIPMHVPTPLATGPPVFRNSTSSRAPLQTPTDVNAYAGFSLQRPATAMGSSSRRDVNIVGPPILQSVQRSLRDQSNLQDPTASRVVQGSTANFGAADPPMHNHERQMVDRKPLTQKSSRAEVYERLPPLSNAGGPSVSNSRPYSVILPPLAARPSFAQVAPSDSKPFLSDASTANRSGEQASIETRGPETLLKHLGLPVDEKMNSVGSPHHAQGASNPLNISKEMDRNRTSPSEMRNQQASRMEREVHTAVQANSVHVQPNILADRPPTSTSAAHLYPTTSVQMGDSHPQITPQPSTISGLSQPHPASSAQSLLQKDSGLPKVTIRKPEDDRRPPHNYQPIIHHVKLAEVLSSPPPLQSSYFQLPEALQLTTPSNQAVSGPSSNVIYAHSGAAKLQTPSSRVQPTLSNLQLQQSSHDPGPHLTETRFTGQTLSTAPQNSPMHGQSQPLDQARNSPSTFNRHPPSPAAKTLTQKSSSQNLLSTANPRLTDMSTPPHRQSHALYPSITSPLPNTASSRISEHQPSAFPSSQIQSVTLPQGVTSSRNHENSKTYQKIHSAVTSSVLPSQTSTSRSQPKTHDHTSQRAHRNDFPAARWTETAQNNGLSGQQVEITPAPSMPLIQPATSKLATRHQAPTSVTPSNASALPQSVSSRPQSNTPSRTNTPVYTLDPRHTSALSHNAPASVRPTVAEYQSPHRVSEKAPRVPSQDSILKTPSSLAPSILKPTVSRSSIPVSVASQPESRKRGLFAMFRSKSNQPDVRHVETTQKTTDRKESKAKSGPSKVAFEQDAKFVTSLASRVKVPPPIAVPIPVQPTSGRKSPSSKVFTPFRYLTSKRHRTMSAASLEAQDGTAPNTIVGSPTASMHSSQPPIAPPPTRDPYIATQEWRKKEAAEARSRSGGKIRRQRPGVVFDVAEDLLEDQKRLRVPRSRTPSNGSQAN